MSTNAILCLPAMLDLKAAAALRQELHTHEGAALDVDASKVERVGGLCLQVLIAAAAAWRQAGRAFRIQNPSLAFADDVALLGATQLLSISEGDA
ncbi:MAG: STAS domain-containing protein [Pseudomonadota bacterium]